MQPSAAPHWVCVSDYLISYIYIYTGKPPPGSRNQWFINQLVDGSMLGCWLQVAGDLVIYWLPGYLLLVTGLLVTGLSGYVLVTGSLKSKRTVAVGLFYWPRCLWFHRWLLVAGYWLVAG